MLVRQRLPRRTKRKRREKRPLPTLNRENSRLRYYGLANCCVHKVIFMDLQLLYALCPVIFSHFSSLGYNLRFYLFSGEPTTMESKWYSARHGYATHLAHSSSAFISSCNICSYAEHAHLIQIRCLQNQQVT